MQQKPLILVTNDDGVSAPGILHLSSIAKKFGDVYVIAPDKPQSGMGHAITINATLRIQKTNYHAGVIEEYSCTGTPVDCVKMAVNKLLPRKPDLVLSGINHGSNSSINVIYSGTMSAAIEGSLEGTSAVGFSLSDYDINADFSATSTFVEKIIASCLKDKLPNGVCLNVNFPKLKADEISGLKVCRQAKANWVEDFEERKDPYGRSYYWLTGKFVNFEPDAKDTDEWALANGYVSVVPIMHDLTAHNYITHLKKTHCNMLDKIDKKWIGFLFGAVFPSLCFFCYWLFFHNQLNFPNGFIRYLRAGNMFQEVAIVCVIANLAIFYLSLNKKIFDFGRGLIIATFLYVGLVLYISLL